MGNIIIDRRRKRRDITSKNKRERRKALREMTLMGNAFNIILDDSYCYQIPFGSIPDIISKEWLKKVKPKKRMTKKEYRRWKNKMKRLGVA